MKRLLYLLTLTLLLSVGPVPGLGGYADFTTNMYWCTSEFTCLHEQAHLIDKQAGWVSKTDEYKIALLSYVVENKATVDDRLLTSLIKEPMELYADVYAIFDGQVPEQLVQFYPVLRGSQVTLLKYGDSRVVEVSGALLNP